MNFNKLTKDHWLKSDFFRRTYNIPLEVAQKYADSLSLHIYYVRVAGEKIGVDAALLQEHDESKWSIHEFPGYALHFFGGGNPAMFSRAWLHHLHHNPHHWQHWMFPDGLTPAGSDVVDGVLPMPKHYALEMIADWMGAGRAYQGHWDMSGWLVGNLGKVRLHPETKAYVIENLTALGYIEQLKTVGWVSNA